MRFCISVLLMFALNSISSSCLAQSLEKSFLAPPDSVQTGVYWYWMSDNISRQGVIKDLQAMKKAGITLAFIGIIGPSTHHHQNYPYGKVRFMSPEWWDVMHTALKTASDLGIDIGIFNAPGWSQSGGPWVKPEQAMRYLASTEIQVKGPVAVNQKLSKPANDFQDVKVLAFQAVRKNLFNGPVSITKLSDTVINLQLPDQQTVRSILVYPGDYLNTHCTLQVKDGDRYRTITTFRINRDGSANLQTGWDQRAPVVGALPETSGTSFRLLFSKTKGKSAISSIVLSPSPVVHRFPEKTYAKFGDFGPVPPAISDPSLFVAPDKVLDISKHLSTDGVLNWDVPAGDWVIMRLGMTPTNVTNSPTSPEATGLEADKINSRHIIDHFNNYLGEIIKRIPAADRKCWKYTVLDSWEKGSQNITDNMLQKFEQRYGYDPVPYLPTYYGYPVGSYELTERFLWDLHRFIADEMAYQYVVGLREMSNKHGLKIWLENYGHYGFSGEFLQYGGQSDEISGEFWRDQNTTEKRGAASCAHIYGKTRVWSESFTNGKDYRDAYMRYPGLIKSNGDLAFSQGINSLILHVYIQQYANNEYPGVDGWFGTEFNRKNTWFSQIDQFVQYIRRTSFLLQQGHNVADVAYYIGENTPIMSGSMKPELPQGYSFDFINSEVLIRDLTVKNGKLILPNGTTYKILVLPPDDAMRPAVLQQLEKLVAEGAVIIGLPPNHSPGLQNYPQADMQLQQLAAKMWTTTDTRQWKTKSEIITYGKGKIIVNKTLEEAFELLQVVPDCFVAKSDSVVFTHRSYGQGEIYFLANRTNKSIQINPLFRVVNKQPELWDPVNGSMRLLPAFIQTSIGTQVPLQLAPFESAFIVFRKTGKPAANTVQANFPRPVVVAEVANAWKLRFESDSIKRGPSGTVTFNQLEDWSQSNDSRIRYYSGSAVYRNSIHLKKLPKGKLYLDLGKVYVMAKVTINGRDAGGVWTAPYRLDVTSLLHPGTNEIEVEVVNTWINRILGDLQLPIQDRYVKPVTSPWSLNTPLQSSGLIGPVQLVSISEE